MIRSEYAANLLLVRDPINLSALKPSTCRRVSGSWWGEAARLTSTQPIHRHIESMRAMKTEQQMQNLREALIWWQTVPEANVSPNLSRYTDGDHNRTDCGTVACFGGWCARWPGLVDQGLRLNAWGCPAGNTPKQAKKLFGDADIWSARWSHRADGFFEGSDHALVTNRIRWALEH